jgi:putative mRNA 3-end processing factor
MAHPSTWLKVLPNGLFCEPGGFYIDPLRPVDRAVITHGHSDPGIGPCWRPPTRWR